MNEYLHITNGDVAGDSLVKSGVAGEVFVWHDILYDGPRAPGLPNDDALRTRARFLEDVTGGGLNRQQALDTLMAQYARLKTATHYDNVVLWFDACLFDQSMLCHILTCMRCLGIEKAALICIDAFPGIEPFHGLGQLTPDQLASVYDRRRAVTTDQFLFAERVDQAFARQDPDDFRKLSTITVAPLPWVPAAIRRWLMEQPDKETGLGRLEQLALKAVFAGCESPADIFLSVSEGDTPPQFWGDTTLWSKINSLADRKPPLVRIEGPGNRLPQWKGSDKLKLFRIYPVK